MKPLSFFGLYATLIITYVACGVSDPEQQAPVSVKPAAYTSWIVGDTADAQTQPLGGLVLAGGSTDVDAAMRWLLQRAAGGDVLIIRATGSDGYNNYLYAQLSERVNSVETLLLNSRELASNPDVLRKVRNAEAIFFAGGDQANYVNFYQGTPLADVLNERIRDGAVLGGTSAGCAILGHLYFSAKQGSVTSDEALTNPFDTRITLGQNDFLKHPLLANMLTDQHYSQRDRQGRHVAFLARLVAEQNNQPRGIGVDEKTAVCLQPDGQALVFGEGNAYFLQASAMKPETCQVGRPLTWKASSKAIQVAVVPGSATGTKGVNVATFRPATGIRLEYWSVDAGRLIKP